ncbi:hypothetical protein SAMN05216387_103240 [Nitrosovibrio tenuis]|uniref:Uncharacterized protein n=1 Tax=Nitrosovibrio tenuis TaxID=1233 RepID=A0A1H7KIE5_9PROT|nr:hypothetical protein SAMN05216387_103240 [Nitrosovibrio tenuis]
MHPCSVLSSLFAVVDNARRVSLRSPVPIPLLEAFISLPGFPASTMTYLPKSLSCR